MKIACIAAARPNFMKVKPVLDALGNRDVTVHLVHTGQHYDAAMSDVFFEDLGIRKPDHHLGVGSGTHGVQTAGVLVEFEQLLEQENYDAVVVFGDVTPTLACSLVAAKAGKVVVHVEAGLRSRDWDMPEEVNRVVADRVSDLLLAPSADAVENLLAEGYRDDQVHLVGNVMIDTLLANAKRASERSVAADLGVVGKYGVVTLHRPSNVDDPAQLESLIASLSEVSQTVPLVFSVHPRTRKKIEGMELPSSIHLTEPLGYLDFLNLQSNAAMVLTDSGGIQEETTALGVPCLTLRENTERPITISEGTNRLVGTAHEAITAAAADVIANGVEKRCPALWDGRASQRIADVLLERLRELDPLRPTDLPRE